METVKSKTFTTHMFVGPYKFWYQSDEDCFTFEDFSLYSRWKYGYMLFIKSSDSYLCSDEDYDKFCELAIRQIGLSKLT